jgi:periplasmic protein CpxP/Spy
MDIFKRNKNLKITIVILVVLNLATITLLWLGKPKHDDMRESAKKENQEVRIKEMLKKELDFSDEQAEQFLELRENHKEKAIALEDELTELKKEMFNEAMYNSNMNISDSLLNLTLESQRQLEIITFQHFQKVKQICTPEQQEKLFKLMHRLLGPPPKGGPPPDGPRGELKDVMRPPPGEHPPKGE